MFLFVLIIPDFVFSAIFFLLIGMGSIVGINEDTASYTLGAPFLIYTFFQFTLLTIMIVSVVNTWREVHDHIFVRGELILQAVLLSITVTAQFVIFLADAISTDNEEYDELFYFCYFVMATMLCFCSVLVSTKYLVFRQWQSTRNEEHVPDANTDAVVRTTETDFKAFISRKRGFEAMLSHLALESRDHVNNLVVELLVYYLSVSLNFRRLQGSYALYAVSGRNCFGIGSLSEFTGIWNGIRSMGEYASCKTTRSTASGWCGIHDLLRQSIYHWDVSRSPRQVL